jgi:hypothetical protein
MTTQTPLNATMRQPRDEIPGWEGSLGPFPAEYGKPHVYARAVHSGAGSCVCGAGLGDALHVQAAPGVPVPAWVRCLPDVPDPAGLVAALESLENAMVTSAADWAATPAMAWVYGVIVGWDCDGCEGTHDECGNGPATRELATRFRWSAADVERLRGHHRAVMRHRAAP